MENVQDFYPSPKGSREIAKNKVATVLLDTLYVLPDQDKWRLSYLMDLLVQKYEMDACGEDTDIVTELIQSLCSS